MKKKCEKCLFYHKSNNTCQSKKCATIGDGKITLFDILFCQSLTEERLTRLKRTDELMYIVHNKSEARAMKKQLDEWETSAIIFYHSKGEMVEYKGD